MTVWYDVDIISESTRWQCHGSLIIESRNLHLLLKYLNVTGKFITPILKNLEKLLGHLLCIQKPTMRNDFLKRRRKPLCKDEELGFLWGICRVLERPVLGAAQACAGCWIQAWSYPDQKSEHRTLKTGSPQNPFSFSVVTEILKKKKKEWQFLSISVLFRTSYHSLALLFSKPTECRVYVNLYQISLAKQRKNPSYWEHGTRNKAMNMLMKTWLHYIFQNVKNAELLIPKERHSPVLF